MRTRRRIASTFAACVLLGACGGDGDDGDGSAAADTSRPQIETMLPSHGEVGVSPSAPITVAFTEPVDPGTVTDATVLVATASAPAAIVPANRTVDGEVVTVVPTGGAWPLGSDIVVAVTTGVQDLAGNAAVPWSASFRTAAAP